MTQFQTADILGAINRGEQFNQMRALRPMDLALQRQAIDQGAQNLQFSRTQERDLQQQIDTRTDEQKNKSLFDTAIAVDLARDEDIIPILERQISRVNQLGGNPAESMRALELAKKGDYQQVREGAKRLINIGMRQGDIPVPKQAEKPQGFTLSEGQKRFDAEGNLIAESKVKPQEQQIGIPQVLLEGLSDDLASKASAAYSAAGGGKDGFTAFQKIIDTGSEQERRSSSPELLRNTFPLATEAELFQLQATMDAAKDTETGLKEAGKVREEQRRAQKVQGFQDRAVELLDRILASDQIGDVVGSLEGAYDTRLFSDAEAELIADINEAKDILTSDNLKLMTGVLSESDIQILRNLAGGALNRTRTEEKFREDAQRLRDEMANKRVKTINDQDFGDLTPEEIIELKRLRAELGGNNG